MDRTAFLFRIREDDLCVLCAIIDSPYRDVAYGREDMELHYGHDTAERIYNGLRTAKRKKMQYLVMAKKVADFLRRLLEIGRDYPVAMTPSGCGHTKLYHLHLLKEMCSQLGVEYGSKNGSGAYRAFESDITQSDRDFLKDMKVAIDG